MEIKLKGKVFKRSFSYGIEFGRTQCDMDFSSTGTIARKLGIRKLDRVEVTIRKL